MLKLRLRELADERGYTVERLSQETGLSASTVRRYWNNQVRRAGLPALAAFSRALQVEVGELFHLQEREA